MMVHFIGRDDQAGPRLLYLAADGRIKTHQVHGQAVYRHSQWSSSQFVEVAPPPSSKASSPRRAISSKAASQPVRRLFTGLMTSESARTLISTSPLNPVCSSNGFGMRMP